MGVALEDVWSRFDINKETSEKLVFQDLNNEKTFCELNDAYLNTLQLSDDQKLAVKRAVDWVKAEQDKDEQNLEEDLNLEEHIEEVCEMLKREGSDPLSLTSKLKDVLENLNKIGHKVMGSIGHYINSYNLFQKSKEVEDIIAANEITIQTLESGNINDLLEIHSGKHRKGNHSGVQSEKERSLTRKLESPEEKIILRQLFDKYLNQIGSTIPDFVQHFARSNKFFHIIVNIDKGSIEKAKEFFKEKCTGEVLDVLHYIEQPGKFELAQLIEPGRAIGTTTGTENDAPTYTGTLGFVTKNDSDQSYGVSAMHVFPSTPDSSAILVKYQSQAVPTDVTLGRGVNHFRGNENINGQLAYVDIAVFPIDPAHNYLGFITKAGNPADTEICGAIDDSLLNHQVQKHGATTGFTMGQIVHTDYHVNFQSQIHHKIIVIARNDYHAQSEKKFADRGDSGALVTDILKKDVDNKAYALVYGIEKNFVDEDEITHQNVTFCCGIKHCLETINRKFDMNLKL